MTTEDPHTIKMDALAAEMERTRNGVGAYSYGPVLINHRRIAAGWSIILGVEVTPSQVALCMAWMKIARTVDRPVHRDSYEDGGNYMIIAGALALIEDGAKHWHDENDEGSPIPDYDDDDEADPIIDAAPPLRRHGRQVPTSAEAETDAEHWDALKIDRSIILADGRTATITGRQVAPPLLTAQLINGDYVHDISPESVRLYPHQ